MTGEREIDYESLVQDAMRGVVRSVLTRVAKTGLPGEHHFYIAFRTDAPGVSLSPRLKEKYPEEMTVVLQHRFWDLAVRDTSFEVKLTFDGIPERLSIPYSAIKVFFDPSVPYGLQFEDLDTGGAATEQLGASQGEGARPSPARRSGEIGRVPEISQARADNKKPRTPKRPAVEKATERTVGTSPAKAAPKPPATPPTLVKPDEVAPSKGPKVVSIDAFRKK